MCSRALCSVHVSQISLVRWYQSAGGEGKWVRRWSKLITYNFRVPKICKVLMDDLIRHTHAQLEHDGKEVFLINFQFHLFVWVPEPWVVGHMFGYLMRFNLVQRETFCYHFIIQASCVTGKSLRVWPITGWCNTWRVDSNEEPKAFKRRHFIVADVRIEVEIGLINCDMLMPPENKTRFQLVSSNSKMLSIDHVPVYVGVGHLVLTTGSLTGFRKQSILMRQRKLNFRNNRKYFFSLLQRNGIRIQRFLMSVVPDRGWQWNGERC